MEKSKQLKPPRPGKPWNQLTPQTASAIRTKRAKFRKETDPRYKKCGQWVRALRAYLKMSQAEFARTVGVNYLTIRRWELGWGHFPQPEHARKMVDIAEDCDGLEKWDFNWRRGK